MKASMSKMSPMTFIRLCLSGALAGMALLGVVAPIIGLDASHAREAIGALLGAGAVAIGFKLTRLA